jgi:hypothetical protein
MSSAQHPTFARRGCDGLAQIGPTRYDVVGARFFAPADDAAGGGGVTPPAAPPAPPAPPAAAPPAPPAADAPWTKENFDPERAWRLTENLRTDLATEKQKRDDAISTAVSTAVADAQKAWTQQLAQALGGPAAPETDPVKLNEALTALQTQSSETATKLTAAEQQVKAGQVALQVALHAPALGANTGLLLANEQFKTSIASVEPSDEAAIKAAITKALQDNAALKQPPAASGAGDHTGPTVQSLETLLAKAMKDGDTAASIVLKRRIADAKAQH